MSPACSALISWRRPSFISCTLLVFPWIFSYKKKRLHFFLLFFATCIVCGDECSNQQEGASCWFFKYSPMFSYFRSAFLCLTWSNFKSFFSSLQSHLRTKYAPQETVTAAHLSTFFLFQNTGTTTLTRTHTRWSLKTSRRPTSQSCRACRLSTRPATPSDTTQKAWLIQIWGHIRMCCSSQWVLLWARRVVLVVYSVLFYAKHSLIWWFLMFIFTL